MQVSSVDYSSDISPLTISVPITVECTDDTQLFESWTTPVVWYPSAYDETYTWTGPTYFNCQAITLNYEIYNLNDVASGQLSWMTIDSSTFLITATLTRQAFIDFHGTTLEV